jgi:hypothetical protein
LFAEHAEGPYTKILRYLENGEEETPLISLFLEKAQTFEEKFAHLQVMAQFTPFEPAFNLYKLNKGPEKANDIDILCYGVPAEKWIELYRDAMFGVDSAVDLISADCCDLPLLPYWEGYGCCLFTEESKMITPKQLESILQEKNSQPDSFTNTPYKASLNC